MSDDISAKLASNLKRLREERGLSQASLAEVSKVPRPTIAHLESGQANPTLSVVLRVAHALGVTVDGLVDEGEVPLSVGNVRELPLKKSTRSRRVTVAPKGSLRESETEWITLRADARLKLDYPERTTHVFVVQSGTAIFSVLEQTVEVGPEGVVRAIGDVVLESGEGAEIFHVHGRNP